jgi:lipopolysaccharide transport system ATP-binding protein
MYRLGTIGTGTISHDLNRWWHRMRGKEDPYLKIGETNVSGNKSNSGYVWALKDINLEVMPGEVLGIIGKNGAGKSTLLKILSRVTGPTTGRISYKGRIGSLLEVGTGFHPELTGRENIFLNGAILGMTKAEISSKLDEIVDFAGVERYIDTPVKRYSSGMRVRLGFAVAAFLEPDILVVDEVLAVGDAEFQKKAIGKMQDVSHQEGRTILFVSHNMAAVKSLCTRGIMLESGRISFTANALDTVDKYLMLSNIKSHTHLSDRVDRQGSGKFRFTKIELLGKNETIIENPISGEFLRIRLEYKTIAEISDKTVIGIQITDLNENKIASFITDEMGTDLNIRKAKGAIILDIEKLRLRGGKYAINLFSFENKPSAEETLDIIHNACQFEVLAGDFYNSGNINRSVNIAMIEGTIYAN